MSYFKSLFPGSSVADRCRSCLGLLYILLLFLPVALPYQPLLVADLLAPFMALLLCWQWRDVLRVCREHNFTLPAFLALAGIATFFHLLRGSGNLYDLAIFTYMAMIYVYFRLNPATAATQQWLGLAGLIILLLGFFYACLALCLPWLPDWGFFYRDPYSAGRGLKLLGLRYQFLFANPNLLGSFYVLPISLAFPWLVALAKKCNNVKSRLSLAAGAVLLLLPLFSSASKHMLMSFALLCAVPLQAWPEIRRPLKKLLMPGLILFALLCLLTVLLPVFPLSKQFPYINIKYQGNYTIHQEIYLKMLTMNRSNWLLGLGNKGCREAYPQLADRDKIEPILKNYNFMHCIEPYSQFMDPHHEYLNIASLFGLPALICCMAFWLKHLDKRRSEMLLFCAALLFCCLWDDLLSKRWLWLTLATLANRGQQSNE